MKKTYYSPTIESIKLCQNLMLGANSNQDKNVNNVDRVLSKGLGTFDGFWEESNEDNDEL